MAHENSENSAVSTSKFHMLRCLIAMAHADGIICDEEREYMFTIMSNLPLSDEQTATLQKDFDEPQAVEMLFSQISDPEHRGQLTHMALLMANKDGMFDPSEEDLLEKMRAGAMEGLDMEALRQEIRQIRGAAAAEIDLEIEDQRAKRGGTLIPWFQLFDERAKIRD